MSNVERTAIAEFSLNDLPVRVGQVVSLNENQLDRLSDAGCVYKDKAKNDLVPKSELPVLKSEASAPLVEAERARIAEARQLADAEIAEIDQRVKDRKASLLKEAEDLERNHAKAIADAEADKASKLTAIEADVAAAQQEANAKIASIGQSVEEAQKSADAAKSSKAGK